MVTFELSKMTPAERYHLLAGLEADIQMHNRQLREAQRPLEAKIHYVKQTRLWEGHHKSFQDWMTSLRLDREV